MKQHKIYIVIFIAIFLSSCGTLKEGFTNQKKNNTDEFLIEKKSPLVMPPDYNELPIPNEENIENDSNEIKSLISKSKNIENEKKLDEKKSTFENSILKKIKKN
jgi:PBP1b-binding outer membrane lipoprotein LpoB